MPSRYSGCVGLFLLACLMLTADAAEPASKEKPPSEALRHLPGDVAVFMHVRVADIRGGELEPFFRKDKPLDLGLDYEEDLGIAAADIESYTIFLLSLPAELDKLDNYFEILEQLPKGFMDPLVIITTKKPIDRKELLKRAAKKPDADSTMFLSDRALLLSSPKALLNYSNISEKKPAWWDKNVPTSFVTRLKALSKEHTVVMGCQLSSAMRKVLAGSIAFKDSLSGLSISFGKKAEKPADPETNLYPLLNLTSGIATLDLQKQVVVTIEVETETERSTALASEAIKTGLAMAELDLEATAKDGFLNLRKSVRQAIAGLRHETKGRSTSLTVKLALDWQELEQLMEQSAKEAEARRKEAEAKKKEEGGW